MGSNFGKVLTLLRLACIATMMGSICPWLSIITAQAQVRSCSRVMVSILDDARSCLTCCGSPDTNAHIIQHSGSGPPTNWFRRCKSVENSSTVLFCWSWRAVNLSNALKASLAYAVIRALFISSGFVLCSWLRCRYTVRAPPRSYNGSTCSTLFIAYSSQPCQFVQPLLQASHRNLSRWLHPQNAHFSKQWWTYSMSVTFHTLPVQVN